jgi:hypothetical protein
MEQDAQATLPGSLGAGDADTIRTKPMHILTMRIYRVRSDFAGKIAFPTFQMMETILRDFLTHPIVSLHSFR